MCFEIKKVEMKSLNAKHNEIKHYNQGAGEKHWKESVGGLKERERKTEREREHFYMLVDTAVFICKASAKSTNS